MEMRKLLPIMRYINNKRMIHYIYTIFIGIVGGLLFSYFSLPLPWILGPMTFTIIFSFTYKEVSLHPAYSQFGFYVLGIAIGLYFSPQIGRLIFEQVEIIVTFSIITIFLGLLNGLLFKYLFKMDLITAIFSSVPGGMVQMVEVGAELGGEAEVIAIKQTLRVIVIVTVIPNLLFLFPGEIRSTAENVFSNPMTFTYSGLLLLLLLGFIGLLLARIFRFPAAVFTGPLLLISVVSLLGFNFVEIPSILLHTAQLFIGITVGSQFKKEQFIYYKKYVFIGFLSSITLMLFSFMMVYPLMLWANIDFATAMLSLAPGGIAEMSITAVALGANVPLVVAFQVLRTILSVVFLPNVIKLILRKRKKRFTL